MDLKDIRGIGPKTVEALTKLNIYRPVDLLYNPPRKYEDRKTIRKLVKSNIGENYLYKVKIMHSPLIRNARMMTFEVSDGTCTANVVYFNMNFLKNKFKAGSIIYLFGKLTHTKYGYQFANPEFFLWYDDSKLGELSPIYNLNSKIRNNKMISLVKQIISFESLYKEILPYEIIDKRQLLTLKESVYNIHFPKDDIILEKARKSLAYREMFSIEFGFKIMNKNCKNEDGIIYKRYKEEDDFLKGLSFELTADQIRTIEDINKDMESSKVMNRLVQGDVGSGKTIVCIYALYKAFLNSYQSAIMAPTEILALQHYESIKSSLEKFGVKISFLSSSIKKSEKTKILEDIKNGNVDIVVGTHALLQENVIFKNLGLVVTDEQHRFGVKQRADLSNKANKPDTLVMSATPIPRTLSLIFYGDLDISSIKTMPPGRRKVETYAVPLDYEQRLLAFIKKQVENDHQVYVVCPLIESSDSSDLNSASEVYERFRKKLSGINIELLHGKLKSEEKNKIVEDFEKGKVDLLVSTTVVEVGINVKNASLMVVYNAERFGLSQLHQLRGRVGRSDIQSYCVLVYGKLNDISFERLRIMQATSDGFEISQKDLVLRGPGEFFGTSQHGLPSFNFFDFEKDMDILEKINEDIKDILYKKISYEESSLSNILNENNKIFYKNKKEIILN